MPLALLTRFLHPTAQHELTISNPQSDTFLFADDIIIFRSIINTNDQDKPQQDITTREKFSQIACSHYNTINVHMEIGKNNVGENQYYTTMNNVTKQ